SRPSLILKSKSIVNSVNNIARPSAGHEWRAAPRVNLARVTAALAVTVALVLCWRAAEIRPTALFERGTAAALWAFIRGLFPPDLSLEFLRVVGSAIIRTAALAITGTTLAIAIGLPLGVM